MSTEELSKAVKLQRGFQVCVHFTNVFTCSLQIHFLFHTKYQSQFDWIWEIVQTNFTIRIESVCHFQFDLQYFDYYLQKLDEIKWRWYWQSSLAGEQRLFIVARGACCPSTNKNSRFTSSFSRNQFQYNRNHAQFSIRSKGMTLVVSVRRHIDLKFFRFSFLVVTGPLQR